MKPAFKCLDLFSGAGGAGEGYRRAGFDVTGVDIKPQPRNPHRFIQADAICFLREHGPEYDFIHASPPCQGYSTLAAMHPGKQWPKLIDQVRSLLKATGKHYAIENVESAPLHRVSDLFGNHGVMLCGTMFGLGVERGFLRRHRIFETSFPVPQPNCQHNGKAVGVYGHGGYTGKHRMLYREEASIAMGIDWMNRDEMCQAIPPAYTEWLGNYAIKLLMKKPRQIAALFVRRHSIYKTMPGVDCYDIERDAQSWAGGCPVVAHPPCRAWGRLSHMAKPREGERDLGPWAVEQVRRWGGVLEHPAASRLWAACELPKPDYGIDAYGGWTLEVHQSWWGHPCTKPTWLYVCGCTPADVPSCMVTPRYGTHAICKDRRAGVNSRNANRPEIRHGDRDMTPTAFAEWLVELARNTSTEKERNADHNRND